MTLTSYLKAMSITYFSFSKSQDQHEICFVGEEGFNDLSQVDPEGDALLQKAMEDDKSKEWYERKKLSKESA